jgi:Flp pilus assembly protein TadG
MSGTSVLRKIRASAGRFAKANGGNIAVIFALSAVPLISFVGAAIDYTRASAARSSMQAALDSAALMLSKDLSNGTISVSQIDAKATDYFNALYTNKDALNAEVKAKYDPPSGGTPASIKLDGKGKIITDFMRVAGFPEMNFNTSSTTNWGNVRMRVALVLDVTGSMDDDGKMPAMIKAAKDLVDQLSPLATTAGDIYISVVPFAKDVNVGTTFNTAWIDWTDWDADNGFSTCTATNKKGKCTASFWTPNDHATWNGCVTDRTQNWDTLATAPTAGNAGTLFPAEQYSYCNSGTTKYLQPIMPLSYDWTALKTRIDALKPTGNTNQGIGIAWGWLTLSTDTPFSAPTKDPNYVYKDAIVVLSDGMNTQNRWYSNSADIDARQKILCANAKAAGITIYAVQVNTGTPADPTSTVLQYCAQNTSSFYLVTAASQTASVFKEIGTQLAKLRVAK